MKKTHLYLLLGCALAASISMPLRAADDVDAIGSPLVSYSFSGNADDSAAAEPASDNSSNNAPADKAKLQQYLDQINATVHFDFGSSEPKFDNKTDLAIRALCAAMKADSRVKILITGHTDNVGTAQGNMNYGKKRAEALKQLMVKQGAPAGSISTASKGQNEPVVDNDTEEHRYQNRRAVVTLR